MKLRGSSVLKPSSCITENEPTQLKGSFSSLQMRIKKAPIYHLASWGNHSTVFSLMSTYGASSIVEPYVNRLI
jgi:hypothetical protein